MDVRQDWPERGRTVTFAQWDFDAGKARFIGIGVVAGPAQQHPYLDLYRFPIMPRPGDERAVPEWINESDIIDVVPR
ncbi:MULTISPECIES: hypothetical protein [Actinokineospora]|uniref:Uncharacterized protein n=1 Tax=Actinokineospora alba TaxID=504798 RepID=A0A1H0UKG1_9PSEU|nr:hypothetical protein [Actinokineospora alba]TDP65024.1 hypothetical protein C8E96_0503 [Actinokineospora alba]SDH52190.1 hypothetical protein SAMN05421871_101326 [Actinokineospora alba]SDP66550.1 hypothetical protein SAMN05192558_111255 [Actinokineospora alba]